MLSHDDGRMDYVWILSKGDMRIYPNKGLSIFSDEGESYWGPNYVMFDPGSLSIGHDLDRRDLRLADWNGDGACDIIWTDPNDKNRPHLWLNQVKKSGKLEWEYISASASQDVSCPEQKSLGFFDRPVALADTSGDGKADYLCIEKDSRTWGYLNNDEWEYLDQIKFSEGKDRANLQWPDVDGDGRADLIHTNKFNGDGMSG